MAFLSGKSAKVLSDKYDLSAFLSGADTSQEAALLETTTFGATARTYLLGFKGGTASLRGYWDGAVAAVDAVLSAALGATDGQVVTIAPDGLTVGKRLHLLLSRLTRYTMSSPVDGVVAITADLQGDGGIDYGVSLHALAAETATGNGASVDNAASSANGGVAHLHATAVTGVGGDTLVVKVQHSPDNAIWADLITFATLTTLTTQERKTVAGTVDRYTRALWTKGGAGTPSYTFTVGFGRR